MKAKNVLIVAELLCRGGLETRLLTQARALVQHGRQVYFATSSPTLPEAFRGLSTTNLTKLAVGSNATAHQCALAAETLAEFIETHKIAVVHAHPFASLVPAAIAAAQTKTPLTLTVHGPSSLVGQRNFDTSLYDAVLPYAASVQLVSEELRALVPTALWTKLHVLPNAVDLSVFRKGVRSSGSTWAIISRLEDGKTNAIEQFVAWSRQLGIEEVHILGAGLDQSRLEQRLTEIQDAPQIRFLGWHNDIESVLRDGYAGVAGQGRVALESTALGLPCILLGYHHIHGLVTPDRFPLLAWSNFSGRGMEPTKVEFLKGELAQVDEAMLAALRNLLETAHDESKLVRRNLALLDQATVIESARPRLLQLYALLRRVDPTSTRPWTQDDELGALLPLLTRRPGENFVQFDTAIRSQTEHDFQLLHSELAAVQESVKGVATAIESSRYGLAGAALRYLVRATAARIPMPARQAMQPVVSRFKFLRTFIG